MDLTGMSDKKKRKKLYGMMVKGKTFYIITNPSLYQVWRCKLIDDGKVVKWGRPKRYMEKPCEWSESIGMHVKDYKDFSGALSGILHAGYDVREVTTLALELNRGKFGRDWNWPRN